MSCHLVRSCVTPTSVRSCHVLHQPLSLIFVSGHAVRRIKSCHVMHYVKVRHFVSRHVSRRIKSCHVMRYVKFKVFHFVAGRVSCRIIKPCHVVHYVKLRHFVSGHMSRRIKSYHVFTSSRSYHVFTFMSCATSKYVISSPVMSHVEVSHAGHVFTFIPRVHVHVMHYVKVRHFVSGHVSCGIVYHMSCRV